MNQSIYLYYISMFCSGTASGINISNLIVKDQTLLYMGAVSTVLSLLFLLILEMRNSHLAKRSFHQQDTETFE